jgi:hypothetical protein
MITLRAAIAATLIALLCGAGHAADLASWNDGPAKSAIVEFVADVIAEGGPARRRADRRVRQ